MVERTFLVFDSESLVVNSSPNGGLTGNPIGNNSSTPNGTTFTYSSGFGRSVTLDDTSRGGGRGRFNDDDPQNHTIVDGGGLVANGTNVESESRIDLRALDDNGAPSGPVIQLWVFSKDGNTGDIWGFAARLPLQDGVSYVKVNGSNNGTSVYGQYITCFASGTLIDTGAGSCAVEDLAPGDPVWTLRNGTQRVRWCASTTVAGAGRYAPVRITAGALGNDEDLVVSQQHRVWIESAMAELYFGQSEVLVAAKHLCGLPGIEVFDVPEIAYTHFMFDSHQIVRANGLLTESFFLGEGSVAPLDAETRAELTALFPMDPAGIGKFGATAAPALSGREARALVPHLR